MLLVVLSKNTDLRVCGRTSIVAWLIMYAVFSLLNTLDIGTDSMFAAATGSAFSCGNGDTLKELWRSTWAQSLFGRVQIPAPDIDLVVLSLWLLSFLQFFWPVVTSLDRRYGGRAHGFCYVSSLSGKEVYYSDVVWDLGDASGMATIAKFQAEKEKKTFHDGRDVEARRDAGDWVFIDGLVDVMPKRVFLTWIGENALQINLQTTMFALTKAAAASEGATVAKSTQLQAISISIFATLVKLFEAREWLLLVSPFIDEPGNPNRMDRMLDEFVVRARRARWFVRFGCMALIGTLAYAMAKLVGASVCPDALLNITGCVVLED
eukprot:TRINITY_DN16217_c0_g1_i1.p2 TRINITY_DN16217_c0_g1~~TRINITY_DN16217_c0_g1_i1.p2  ORF type:complete len:321 (-),score=24.57 TRINITY_DN16217_c0_g1_i1:158-1120(-)